MPACHTFLTATFQTRHPRLQSTSCRSTPSTKKPKLSPGHRELSWKTNFEAQNLTSKRLHSLSRKLMSEARTTEARQPCRVYLTVSVFRRVFVSLLYRLPPTNSCFYYTFNQAVRVCQSRKAKCHLLIYFGIPARTMATGNAALNS